MTAGGKELEGGGPERRDLKGGTWRDLVQLDTMEGSGAGLESVKKGAGEGAEGNEWTGRKEGKS